MGKVNSSSISGASRIRAGQGICVLRQGILGHFRPLLDIFGAKGLFKDTFLFEGRGCIPLLPPPRCAPENKNTFVGSKISIKRSNLLNQVLK